MNWASGYWIFMRLICASIAVPAFLSVAALVSVFIKKNKSEQIPQPSNEERDLDRSSKESRENVQMLISCSKRKKVFGRPLIMLDISNGKTKLVSVCQYCNNELSSLDQEEGSSIRTKQNEETTLQSQGKPPLDYN